MNISSITIVITVLIFFLQPVIVHPEEKYYKDYTDIGPIEQSDITIEQVISSPEEFNKEVITLDGRIRAIEYKQIFGGKKFTLFELTDGNNNKINVYARGYIEKLSNGSKIRLHGRYSKNKRFMFKKFNNVMKARKVQVLKDEMSSGL